MTNTEKRAKIFQKTYWQIAGVVLLLLVAVFLIWNSNANSNQAVSALVAQVRFWGEYRIGDGQWQEYKKAQEKEEELNKELEEYIRKLQEANNKLYVGGEFIWPLDHKYSRISSPFGWRYLWGNLDNHQAIDIPCALNAPVYASNGGTIIKATHHSSYGNYVIIDHGGGRSTLYAHNNSLKVKEGDEVYQGQVIALAGTTGASTGVHVHFEYRVNGVRQNPLNVVSQP
jgi:murein DD-endopeptidase MepM/ murein hydrolase activator NlpD